MIPSRTIKHRHSSVENTREFFFVTHSGAETVIF